MVVVRKFYLRKAFFFWLILNLLIGGSLAQERVIERILAIVEGEIITLTDVQIAWALGLYSWAGEAEAKTWREVLDKLIEVKVVLKLAESAKIKISPEDLENSWTELKTRLGEERYLQLKQLFGFSDKDIRKFIREKLIFDQIIQKRITLVIPVSLDEIKDYYQNVYLKEMAAQHQKPRSLVEVMRELEERIRRKKGQAEVKKWLETLRSQADIVIKTKEVIDFD